MAFHTRAERVARVQAILGTRFTNFKSEFLPFRSRYEAASYSWYTASNSVPNALEGQLGHIQYMIATGKEPLYTTGGTVYKTIDWWDPENTNTSGWNARVVGRIERLADRIASHLGTTYTVSSKISSDGNFVTYSYSLIPPVDNEKAEAFQQALTAALGGSWPLLADDQLRLLNQQLFAIDQGIAAFEAAKIVNPDSTAIFQQRIDKLEHSRELTLPWLDYVASGVLPSEESPEFVLSAPIIEYIDEPGIDEASEITKFRIGSDILQHSEDVVEKAASDEYFASVASTDEKDALIFAKEDPADVLRSPVDVPPSVEDVRTLKGETEVFDPLDVTDDAVLGPDPGFIPEAEGVPVTLPPSFFPPSPGQLPTETVPMFRPEDVSDEFVETFDTFEGDFTSGGGSTGSTGTDDEVNPQNTAAEKSTFAKKAIIAAVISAILFKL